jgi:hypothetical protein
MTTNGIADTEPLPPALLAIVRAEVLAEQRLAIIKEREMLTVRYRVQKRIGAKQAALDDLTKGLEEIELALAELEELAREWGCGGSLGAD